jgi:hypothetical protein
MSVTQSPASYEFQCFTGKWTWDRISSWREEAGKCSRRLEYWFRSIGPDLISGKVPKMTRSGWESSERKEEWEGQRGKDRGNKSTLDWSSLRALVIDECQAQSVDLDSRRLTRMQGCPEPRIRGRRWSNHNKLPRPLRLFWHMEDENCIQTSSLFKINESQNERGRREPALHLYKS